MEVEMIDPKDIPLHELMPAMSNEQKKNIAEMLEWALKETSEDVYVEDPLKYRVNVFKVNRNDGSVYEYQDLDWATVLLFVIPQSLGMRTLIVDIWNWETLYEQVWDRYLTYEKSREFSMDKKFAPNNTP